MEHHMGPGAPGCVPTTLHQHVAVASAAQQQQQQPQQPSPVQHLIHHHHQVAPPTPIPQPPDPEQQQQHHSVAAHHAQHQHQQPPPPVPPPPQPQHHHQQQQPTSHHAAGAGRGRNQAGQHFCLRWNNFQMNITSVFEHLLRSETFVDVTLACDGSQIKAHKMVLSACSPYFQQLLAQNPCKHPIIILPQEVRMSEMKCIIDFVYRGEIDVAQEQLPDLLKVADALQIKGLCEVTEKGSVTSSRGRNRQLLSYRPALRHSRLSHPFKYRRRHLETLTRRNQARGRGTIGTMGNGPTRVASTSGLPVGLDAVKTECLDELVIKKENVGTQVLLHSSPTGVMNAGMPGQPQPQHHQQHHHQQDGQEYFVLKPVGQHSLGPPGHQGMDMLSPGMPMQQNDGMVMMMAADGSEHADYGQQHQYQQQHVSMWNQMGPSGRSSWKENEEAVTYQTASTPVSMGYPMTATPQPMQGQLGEQGQLHHGHHQTGHLQHHPVLKDEASDGDSQFAVGPELLGLVPTSGPMSHTASQASGECVMGSPSPSHHPGSISGAGMKNWTEHDLESALDALRQKSMSLTRASAHFGIPSTTLWQRAHRAGVDIPRHMSPMKTWTDDDLRSALEAMRAGTLSAHRASKEYGIPSSTLYKIAKKEGIKLAQPFNSTPPSWSREDLRRAFDAIKSGMSVTKASSEFGIPSGTLYGKCRREGIELRGSKESANWSEEDLVDALEAVRVGEMSINQASLHFNVPYSTLYNRFRKCAMAEEEEEDQHKQAMAGAAGVMDQEAAARAAMMVGPNGRIDVAGPSGASTSSTPADGSQVLDVSGPGSVSGPGGLDSMDMSQASSAEVESHHDSRMNSPSELHQQQQQQQQHYETYAQQQHHGQPPTDVVPMTPVPQS